MNATRGTEIIKSWPKESREAARKKPTPYLDLQQVAEAGQRS